MSLSKTLSVLLLSSQLKMSTRPNVGCLFTAMTFMEEIALQNQLIFELQLYAIFLLISGPVATRWLQTTYFINIFICKRK